MELLQIMGRRYASPEETYVLPSINLFLVGVF